MEVTRNFETAQRMAPKFCMQIPIRLCRTWAGSNVDRVHHLEENWNFKKCFRAVAATAARKIVDRPTSGCEPAAVCNCRRCNSSAYRQGNRVSVPGLRQQQQAAARRTRSVAEMP